MALAFLGQVSIDAFYNSDRFFIELFDDSEGWIELGNPAYSKYMSNSKEQTVNFSQNNPNSCHHCQGTGYVEIRDCTGEIQRSETCVFCQGTGSLSQIEED